MSQLQIVAPQPSNNLAAAGGSGGGGRRGQGEDERRRRERPARADPPAPAQRQEQTRCLYCTRNNRECRVESPRQTACGTCRRRKGKCEWTHGAQRVVVAGVDSGRVERLEATVDKLRRDLEETRFRVDAVEENAERLKERVDLVDEEVRVTRRVVAQQRHQASDADRQLERIRDLLEVQISLDFLAHDLGPCD
ncbi:hypothetical protein EUX98_g8339 [Antrodiella citrinella]|uniref:Zn(2)-C6 fungal-type domain-containing protein n=1 Tax=Antrodiella citrinella TaxID=2447956 RepID=A0A4S4M8M6_9APHY|nr:hypothetical protein EUX98_g8339 [Antrodiella citrinella]